MAEVTELIIPEETVDETESAELDEGEAGAGTDVESEDDDDDERADEVSAEADAAL